MAIDKAITDLPVATEIGDEDYLVLQQNNAAKSVRGAIVKKYAGDVFNDAKDALLALLSKVVYIDENGQQYLDNLEAALMRKVVLSITAVFEQGQNVIYDTDSLDTLKQYLTVTANYDDGTSAVVTGYTLSGTLAVGTSTITVEYGGKSTTFNVVVSAYWDYEWDYTMGKLEEQEGFGSDVTGGSSTLTSTAERITVPSSKYFQIYVIATGSQSALRNMTDGLGVIEAKLVGHLSGANQPNFRVQAAQSSSSRCSVIVTGGKFKLQDNSNLSSCTVLANFVNDTEYTLKIVCKGTTADVYVNGEKVGSDISMSRSIAGTHNNFYMESLGTGYYIDLKSVKFKIGSY